MNRWWRRTAGGLPATFWYLWTASLINRTGAVGQLYLGVYLLTVRDFDAGYAGLVIGLGGIGTALGALPGGILADRWGRRPAMLVAGAPAAIVMVALGRASDRTMIAVLVVLIGFCLGAVRPAFTASIIDVVAVADRSRALNLNYWAFNLGSGAAALLAGMLVRTDPASLFAVNGAVLMASTVLLAVKVPETRPAVAAATGRGGLGVVVRDRVFMTFVGLAMLGWTMIETNKMLPVAIVADGLDVTSYGRVIVVNMVLIVAGQLVLPRLVDHRRREHVLAASVVLAGAGFGLVTLADTLWAYALTVAVWTVGEMLMTVANSALAVELAPPGARGRYQGVFNFGLTAAMFLGPAAGGLVVTRFGPDTLWVAVFCLGLLLAVAHLAARPGSAAAAVDDRRRGLHR
ncbi:MFS transporter [Actinoplanes campanulatus]|uniref:MFS transporter n=1 Tax=Actinoplanes campanulatus TaxID=113559 RepID=UPI0016063953|nr:MFS transporter [Actinoplanes campanulatus]GGN32697.1 MFS transporter [Actinoplanes campanulatus]GID39969.1 MFS transporter [Actinoplanes campanulatus]